MHTSPYKHGLSLAWRDGGLSRNGLGQLARLHSLLQMDEGERAVVEEEFLDEEVVGMTRTGFGRGEKALKEWLDALEVLLAGNITEIMKRLGRASLDTGLSKERVRIARHWARQLGEMTSFMQGLWLDSDGVEPLSVDDIPSPLTPFAHILLLVDEEPSVSIESGRETVTTSLTPPSLPTIPEVTIEENERVQPVMTLSANYLPLHGDGVLEWFDTLMAEVGEGGVAWWWPEGPSGDAGRSTADLAVNDVVLEDYIIKVLESGGTEVDGKSGWRIWNIGGMEVMVRPDSIVVESEGLEVVLKLVIQIDEGDLVETWAAVTLTDSDATKGDTTDSQLTYSEGKEFTSRRPPEFDLSHSSITKPSPPPEELDAGWMPMHDFLTELVGQAVGEFPRQLLRTLGHEVVAESVECSERGGRLDYRLKAPR